MGAGGVVALGLAALSIAGGVTAFGAMLAPRIFSNPLVDAGQARPDGLSLTLEGVQWVGQDLHRDMDRTGFPMPASMMPGAPAMGSERVHLEVSLRNDAGSPRAFGSGEFSLRATAGKSWTPVPGSVKGGSVLPGHLLFFDLLFDLPDGQQNAPLYLAWARGGADVEIPLDSPAPDHGH